MSYLGSWQRLKALKLAQKSWNHTVFGDVHNNLNKVLVDVDSIQRLIESNPDDDALRDQEINAQMVLQNAIHFQEIFLQQKVKVKWHCFGDCNTKFFHNIAKVRHKSNRLSFLRKDGQLFDTQEGIDTSLTFMHHRV